MGSRSWFRGVAELAGESFVSDDVVGEQQSALDLTLGFKMGGAQHKGLTLGAAWQRNLLMDSTIGDKPSRPTGWVAELTYTSYTPPPPPLPPPPPKMNNDPRASLTVSPKEVYPSWSPKVNKATATCVASDPDGDPLTYSWDSTGGRLTGSGASVTWYPPEEEERGRYQITCRVSDGRGGTAQARDDVALIPDPEHPKGIGKVFFEFDRYDLDAEDMAVLDRVASHLRANRTLRVTVEGHTCFIATEEYNLALGQHRADAIRNYLVEAGINLARIETVSYGESRPWKDNSREVTRRLNRRGEFVFAFRPMM
jgi:peptidoglycan-associated lipoprotein